MIEVHHHLQSNARLGSHFRHTWTFCLCKSKTVAHGPHFIAFLDSFFYLCLSFLHVCCSTSPSPSPALLPLFHLPTLSVSPWLASAIASYLHQAFFSAAPLRSDPAKSGAFFKARAQFVSALLLMLMLMQMQLLVMATNLYCLCVWESN